MFRLVLPLLLSLSTVANTSLASGQLDYVEPMFVAVPAEWILVGVGEDPVTGEEYYVWRWSESDEIRRTFEKIAPPPPADSGSSKRS